MRVRCGLALTLGLLVLERDLLVRLVRLRLLLVLVQRLAHDLEQLLALARLADGRGTYRLHALPTTTGRGFLVIAPGQCADAS